MKWRTICKLVVVLHTKLSITGLAFVKSVQDGSQKRLTEKHKRNSVANCQRLLDRYAETRLKRGSWKQTPKDWMETPWIYLNTFIKHEIVILWFSLTYYVIKSNSTTLLRKNVQFMNRKRYLTDAWFKQASKCVFELVISGTFYFLYVILH